MSRRSHTDGSTKSDYLPGGKFGLNCPSQRAAARIRRPGRCRPSGRLLDRQPATSRRKTRTSSRTCGGSRGAVARSTRRCTRSWPASKGALTNMDWTWEAYASYGETHTLGVYSGMMSLERYRLRHASAELWPEYVRTRATLWRGTSRRRRRVARAALPMVWGVSGYGPGLRAVSRRLYRRDRSRTPKMTGEMGQTVGGVQLAGYRGGDAGRRPAVRGRCIVSRKHVEVACGHAEPQPGHTRSGWWGASVG